MASVTEQIDIFHESILKLHLFEDILNQEDKKETRSKFYSLDEYTHVQKQQIVTEVKTQLRKHASPAIEKWASSESAQYALAHV
jgi:uncharacterized protein YwgA